MKRLLIAFVAIGALLALITGGVIAYVVAKNSAAKERAVAQLKKDAARDLYDPESVRFRDLRLLSYSDRLESLDRFLSLGQEGYVSLLRSLLAHPRDLLSYRRDSFSLCGQLNAKNRVGAYVGYTDFYVSGLDPAKPFVVIERQGWDKRFISNMCNTGAVIARPADDGSSK